MVVLKDGKFQTIKWFDLGLHLHLSYDDLTKIKTDYPDSDERLRECLASWLKRDTAATWDTLANAISTTGYEAAADHISKINNYNIHSLMIFVGSVKISKEVH